MNFLDLNTDEAVLAELGRRLAQLRIDRNITQAELARKAGETTQTRTLFRLLRELDLFEKLELVFPEPAARPSQLIKQEGKLPQRASRKTKDSGMDGEWKWGDER